MQPRMILIVMFTIGALAAQANDLSLIGKLTKMPAEISHCGWARASSMTEYEVIRVSSGVYTKPIIYVMHACIDLPRSGHDGTLKKFKIGDLHKLVLSTEDTYSAVDSHITDKDKHKDGGGLRPKEQIVYYCKRVDKYWQLLWLHN